jgi:hypothetical protein
LRYGNAPRQPEGHRGASPSNQHAACGTTRADDLMIFKSGGFVFRKAICSKDRKVTELPESSALYLLPSALNLCNRLPKPVTQGNDLH